jgi:hypothetical protein
MSGPNQLSPAQQQREMDFIRNRRKEAASATLADPVDYAAASWFVLERRAALGDLLAQAEMVRRHS